MSHTTISDPDRMSARRRWPLALLALLILAAAVFVATPIGRRLVAQPARVSAVTGVTGIRVIGDPAQNHIFTPAVIRVPAGTTVTWTFADTGAQGGGAPVPHDVVFSDARSALLATGTYQRTFTAPGSYSYVCSLHPFMEGRVEVVDG